MTEPTIVEAFGIGVLIGTTVFMLIHLHLSGKEYRRKRIRRLERKVRDLRVRMAELENDE